MSGFRTLDGPTLTQLLKASSVDACLVLSCYGYPDLIVPHAVKLTVFPRPLAGGQGQYVEINYVVYLTLYQDL